MNKLINKVKDNQYKRKYQRLGKPIKIVLLTDAAFGNLSNGSSQGEQVLFLIDGYGKWNQLFKCQCYSRNYILKLKTLQ